MRRWIIWLPMLVLLGVLSRMPHPARDVARLEPVRTVCITVEAGKVCIETDTGDKGTGKDLPEAAADLKENADGEIFLETAEFLILDPNVQITEDLFVLLRPDCSVVFCDDHLDLKTAADYLSVHKPQRMLAHLRPFVRY